MAAASGSGATAPQQAWIDRVAPVLVCAVWIAPLAVITIGLLRRPGNRSLDPIYRWAIDSWRAESPLYTDASGFIYLPTFIPIYAPFAYLPQPLGEILWRAIAVAGIAYALWSLMGVVARPRSARGFLLLSVACLPVSLGALQMGQANAWIAMALFQAGASMARGHLWRTAAWLSLGFAIKPIVISAIGLAAARDFRLVPRLIALCGAWIAIPYLLAPAGYVSSQYAAALATITGSCAEVSEHRFADINGLLRSVGLALSGPWSNAVRAGAGLLLAIAVLRLGRKVHPHAWSLIWLLLSACYLLLFNPMTEANSYCMIGVPVALLAWEWLGRGESALEPCRVRYLAVGWATILILLLMGGASEIARPWTGNSLDLWFFPCCAIAAMAVACTRLARPHRQLR
jgi:alpha-1,2-mannosyltransferase